MKDFVIKEYEQFLEIADSIKTPFKFLEISESDVGSDYRLLEAKVWLRTAYLTFTEDVKAEDLPNLREELLQRHGFYEAEIRETAITIR